MTTPPASANLVGFSPSSTNTHTGLKIGSIIVIRNACTVVTWRTP